MTTYDENVHKVVEDEPQVIRVVAEGPPGGDGKDGEPGTVVALPDDYDSVRDAGKIFGIVVASGEFKLVQLSLATLPPDTDPDSPPDTGPVTTVPTFFTSQFFTPVF